MIDIKHFTKGIKEFPVYIQIQTGTRKVEKTVKVSDICLIDVDKEGYPIGIEILK